MYQWISYIISFTIYQTESNADSIYAHREKTEFLRGYIRF